MVVAYYLRLCVHHRRLTVYRHSVLIVAYYLRLCVHHRRLTVYRHSALVIADYLRLHHTRLRHTVHWLLRHSCLRLRHTAHLRNSSAHRLLGHTVHLRYCADMRLHSAHCSSCHVLLHGRALLHRCSVNVGLLRVDRLLGESNSARVKLWNKRLVNIAEIKFLVCIIKFISRI